MFYIAKLARRLARLRLSLTAFPMLSLLCFVVACAAGEPTGISTDPPSLPDAPVVLSPQVMTLEGTQQVLFRAYEADLTTQVTSIEWTTSGGSMAGDGTYSSTATGNFRVVGKRVGNPHNLPDTSTVTVVPVQTTLGGVTVSPSGASVIGGQQQQYTAAGLMTDGSTVAIGVTWSATGGTIDAGGLFRAGNTGGTFQVVATHVTTGIADTVPVTVRAVQSIALSPTSASLSTGGTKQFAVTGTLSDGSTASLTTVGYSASGGTISANGLYTAPLTAGSYTAKAQLAPGSGTGPSATAAVTVIGTTSSMPAPGCNNQPAGYATQWNHSWSVLPPWQPTRDAEGRTIYSLYTPNALSLVSEASAATASGKVLRELYPGGLNAGNAPANWSAGRFGSNGGNLYACLWVRISSNWTNASNPGTKFVFVRTGAYDTGMVTNWVNHFWGFNAGGSPTNMQLMAGLQYADASKNRAIYPSGGVLSLGSWHKIEMLWTANTPGSANGGMRFWLDGSKVIDRSDIMYFQSGQTPQWGSFYPFGTYGGVASNVPYDMWVDIGDWSAATQ